MKSDKYWEGRFVELQRSQLKRADSFAHELEDLHQRMQKEIDDDITVWHKKVATANGISMADAKKLMSRKDRKEFQWTLEEYEQHAKADLLSGVTSAHVMNASANWHLSYLDGMKLQLEHHVDKLYKNIDSKTRNHFKESLNENYLNTAFELQKGIGIGEKMEVPYDERKLENILRTPWASDGKNFSNRIWRDRTQLVNNLQKNLSESVIRGDSDTDMIQALSKDEKKAEFNTRRLVETESAFFDSESERQCCEDFGIEKYRYLAVLDLKTSDICQELDNKVFLEKDRQVGVNAPPMHPFCRSTTAPVVDEDFLTSRRAKNIKTGEYDEIPPDMNYKEWKEKYVEGKDNAEAIKQEQVQIDTPNGYEFETKPLEQKASEGETIHKDTTLPPKEKEEKEFNSEAYNNHVKGKANKQAEKLQELQNKQVEIKEKNKALIEQIENNENISKELKNNIKSNIKNNEKLHESYHIFVKEGTELAEVYEINSNEFIVEKEDNTVDWYHIFESEDFKKDCALIPSCIYDLLFECGLIKEEKEEFLSKFNSNEENLNFVDKMIEYGRKIIKDNAGKNTETSFVIGSSGENLKLKDEDFNQSTEEHRNSLNDKQKAKLYKLNAKNLLCFLVHNHTTNKPPSPEDFNSCFKHEYTCGIIFTNKGSIYLFVIENIKLKYIESKYEFTDKEINYMRELILNLEKSNNNSLLTKDDIYNMIYFKYKKYGFKFKHIYKGRIN